MEKAINSVTATKDDFHSYIRHSMPGYVFIVTLCIYWVILRGPDFLINIEWKGVLAVIGAGFPLGYLLQSVFRAFFVWFALPEVVKEEGGVVKTTIGDALFAKNFDKYGDQKEAAAAWAFEMFLNSEGNEGYQKRLLHLIASIHAAGGAISAICFAHLGLLASFFIKQMKYDWCPIRDDISIADNLVLLVSTFGIFLFLIKCLYDILKDYRNSHSLSMKTFISSRGAAFENFLAGK